MGRTRKKLKRNITGLRNQPKASPIPQILDEGKFPDSAEPHIEVTDPNVDEIPGPDEVLAAHPDNARVLCDEEEITECGDEAHSGEDPEGKTCRRSLRVRQFSLAIHCEDDPRDGDWVPPKLYKKHRQAKKGSRPKTYYTGPDFARMSDRQRSRVRMLWADQTRLDDAGFYSYPKARGHRGPVDATSNVIDEAHHDPAIEKDSGPNKRKCWASDDESLEREGHSGALKDVACASEIVMLEP